jgi:hypothetical protein
MVLLLLLAIAAIVWSISQLRSSKRAQAKLQRELELLEQRYKPIVDVDQEVDRAKERLSELMVQHGRIEAEIESAKRGLTRIHEELALANDAAFLVEIGYYEPRYDFEDVPSYEAELSRIREKQKAMLRQDGTGHNNGRAAAFTTQSLSFNGSVAQGKAAQKKTLKLMLRAFNGESDSFIARVNYRNVEAMEKRIRSAFDAINAITEKYDSCKLNPGYLELRIQELQLVYEWEEAKQREKEEQAKIREQMREEEKAAREAERAQQQADKEEAKYEELLQKAEQEVLIASERTRPSSIPRSRNYSSASLRSRRRSEQSAKPCSPRPATSTSSATLAASGKTSTRSA